MNNYAGVLYMQGACIFMQGGGVMECMVRLVRLGVGGNFFHTLGLHAWHTNVIQNSSPSKSFFVRLPQPIRVKLTAVHAEVPMLWMRLV